LDPPEELTTVPVSFRHMIERKVEAVHVEAPLATITNQHLIVIFILPTRKADIASLLGSLLEHMQ
jgi:hypothetical protein